jgi:hypothetical protein
MQKLRQFVDFIDGYKTYISTIILAAYGVVKAFGVILTTEQDIAILALIGALFGFGISSKVEKLGAAMRGMGKK